MKVVLVHNYYQHPGGEDRVFEEECALLARHGHDVVRYTETNDRIHGMARLPLALGTLWSRGTFRRFRRLLRRERPDVVHFHNTFPLVSPAAHFAAKAHGVPVVQTLHNYRLVCPAAVFYRDGEVCEDCMGKRVPWPGMVHTCYRESFAASSVTAAMITLHRTLGTWERKVDRYIALTNFAREKMVEGGLPADKIVVKPNFVYPEPEPGEGRGGYAVFVGRLSAEKGLDSLLEAWAGMREPVTLKIIGDGPLAPRVREAAGRDARIEWLGHQPTDRVHDILGGARCLVAPSINYETFGRALVEAMAVGTPVAASRLGAMAELVQDGRTGLLFTPGDASSLAACVLRLMNGGPEIGRMRAQARREYQERYTATRSYEILMDTYDRARHAANGG